MSGAFDFRPKCDWRWISCGYIIVTSSYADPNGIGNGGFGDIVIIELVIDFQNLFIFEDSTTLAWFANETCSRDYQVRGYTLPSSGPVLSSDHIFGVSNATSYVLPSDQYTNSEGVDIDYRLVALSGVCPDNRDVLYYRLNGMCTSLWVGGFLIE